MSTRFNPTMSYALLILDNTGAVTKTLELKVNDKLTDLKYIDKNNQEVTVSGTLTGMTVGIVPDMPYQNGNVDLTPEVLSTFKLEGPYTAKNDGKFYPVTTLRIKLDVEEDAPQVFHSLYVPVATITDVGAVVPADVSESEATVVDKETETEDGKTEATVTEVKPGEMATPTA